MRFFIVSVFPVLATALSWNAFDLGLYSIYPTQQFASFNFYTPSVKISQWDNRCSDDGAYVLISPRGKVVPKPGPVILDMRGNLIWMDTRFGQVMNFQVQKYRGNEYLTFWSGTDFTAHSNGSYYLLDSSYEVAHTVSAVGQHGDLHDFKITENNTALITIYQNTETNCSDIGLGPKCWINDGLFQEIRQLLFEWRASDHVSMADSYWAPSGKNGKSKDTSFDFFHINSVHKDPLGNYYVSSRYLHAVICICPSGKTLWTLGGKHNNFTDLSGGSATDFAWQHHVNWHENNTLTIFNNNGNNVFHNRAKFSRGMSVSLGLNNMTATLLNNYIHPDKILAISQGSVQILPDSGNVFVGWGNSPAYTEFTADGQLLCDIRFGASLFFEILDLGLVKSYRAFKSHWVGAPKSPPDIAVTPSKAFVSWNGATEVVAWRLESAESPDVASEEFVAIQKMTRKSFETGFYLNNVTDSFIRAAALDASGKVLAYTEVVKVTTVQSVILLQVFVIVCIIALFCLVSWTYYSMLFEFVGSFRRRNRVQYYELVNAEEQDK
ncbi:hypothetical protein B7463_g8362, partial [Scytalidium lignicola]